MADVTIDELSIKLDYAGDTASTGLVSLKNVLSELSSITGSAAKGLKSVYTPLQQVATVADKLNNVDLSNFSGKITGLSNAVKPLSEIGKSNIGNLVTQLKKIPDLNKTLDSKTITTFAGKVKELSNALVPLANNLSKVGNVLSNMPSKLNKVSNYTTKANSSMASLSSISKLLNFGAVWHFATRAGDALGAFITKSNEYVEDLNLFNVAMGKGAEEAQNWIDHVSEVLGLDPAPMMRYMGVFNMMATGFGLSSEKAEKMSKNLTQLTYDISSFYNLNIDEAAQKVQSAFAGKIICLICKGLHIITYLIAGTPKRVMA